MAKKAETYESLSAKLEAIVAKLGEGNLPLDEMIKLYEEGAGIAQKCRQMLENYKARLEIIENGGTENGDD